MALLLINLFTLDIIVVCQGGEIPPHEVGGHGGERGDHQSAGGVCEGRQRPQPYHCRK